MPVDVRRVPRRWRAAAAVAGLVVLFLAGWWWYSLRPENCYRRGRRALVAGDRQTVVRESRRLLATPGFEAHGRLLAGLLLARDERPAEALRELQSAARDEATAVEALTAAAGCFYSLDRYVDAVNVARAALKKDEQALDARRWLAAALYDLGVTADAAAELQTISASAPGDSGPDRLLGLIDKDNEQFAEAVEHYRESLRRNPREPERSAVLAELAESLVKLSRFDEALAVLGECRRTAPVLSLEAECVQSQGRTDEAENHFREALDLDPRYFPARLKLGMLLLLQSRADDAVGVLEEAVRLAPHSSQAHFQLSQAYGRQGARDKADEQLRLMKEARAVEREFTDLHEEAAKKPGDADIRFRIGVLARQLGKPELSRLWFRAALAVDPRHAAARAALEAGPNAP
ncbi:MAG: tetratricopeptide repeat protein [Deltaproteobacteria bacterium]